MIRAIFWMVAAFAATSPAARAAGPSLSGGLDLRATDSNRDSIDRTGGPDGELNGLFLNFRQVWPDAEGDRWIGVAQVDIEHNFSEVQPYQGYLQYKGPLGKWNLEAGHFLLPFGLLATYDTERLLLGGLETINLGIRHDTGAQWFGRVGDWDYALAITDGLGAKNFADSRANPLVTGRIAYVEDDWQLGFSALTGRVLFQEERDSGLADAELRRVAVDFTRSWGPATVRAEATGGTENGRSVGGGVLLADYALGDKLELNTRAAFWHGEYDRTMTGVGLSYRVANGLFLRVADEYEFGKYENNTVSAQFYYEFSR